MSYMVACSDLDMIAVWIVQRAKSWLSFSTIPQRTEIVISFKITCNRYWARKDVGFLLANLQCELYHDGSKVVLLAAISFAVEDFQTIGFAAYKNVGPKWFPALQTTPTYAPACGLQDTYWGTWPQGDIVMGSEFHINHTLTNAR